MCFSYNLASRCKPFVSHLLFRQRKQQQCVPTLEAELAVRLPQMVLYRTFWATRRTSRAIWTRLDFPWAGWLWNLAQAETQHRAECSLAPGSMVLVTLGPSADPCPPEAAVWSGTRACVRDAQRLCAIAVMGQGECYPDKVQLLSGAPGGLSPT